MNIFALHFNAATAAQEQCDQHVVKMTLETAQLLCSPFEPDAAPYRRTHYNHPCAKWLRESRLNYSWLYAHGIYLAEEYEFRFKKEHASLDIIHWCGQRSSQLELPDIGRMTPFVQAMPEHYRGPDPHEAYKAYYIGEKSRFASWNHNRPPPNWWPRER